MLLFNTLKSLDFKRQTFFNGFFSAFDIGGGNLNSYSRKLFINSDFDAIKSDWISIGQDISSSITNFRTENGEYFISGQKGSQKLK